MRIAIRRRIRGAALLTALLLCAVLHAEENSLLRLRTGTECPVAENVYDTILSIGLLEGEIEATLVSFGKAHPLSSDLLERLKARDGLLHSQAKKVRSALKLAQGTREFYLRAFDSISLSQLQAGKRVRCRVVLIEARMADTVVYVPLIRSIQTR